MLIRFSCALFLAIYSCLLPLQATYAQSASSNYKIEEAFFGSGGELEILSPSYQARTALGELGIVNSVSSNYQTYAGFNTTDVPVLEVFVTGGVYNLGVLTTSTVSAITPVFTVRSHLSSGYTVRLGGTPPKNNSGGHALNNMSSAGASNPGTEQFGVNLAANSLTGPGAFGAVPSQVPDASFSFGQAVSGYGTTNQFKYVENQTIAQSLKSSGVTQYTLSMIANISTVTPGGSYGSSIFVNVVPTF